MQFTESETIKNLAKSYAGESQAGLKYQFISQLCTQMGYKTLADELKAIAKNETNHAKVFYDFIADNTENGISVEFCADYSFSKNEILEGIKSAIQTEYNEAENIYPAFAQIAVNEGFKEIAEKFCSRLLPLPPSVRGVLFLAQFRTLSCLFCRFFRRLSLSL
jgi:rubrerythrin